MHFVISILVQHGERKAPLDLIITEIMLKIIIFYPFPWQLLRMDNNVEWVQLMAEELVQIKNGK